jgi:hypothetical protein
MSDFSWNGSGNNATLLRRSSGRIPRTLYGVKESEVIEAMNNTRCLEGVIFRATRIISWIRNFSSPHFFY